MVEVPAAAECIDHILAEVDYVSIGSNDLVQYLMAADRDNPRVAALCDPLHPAVLRVLRTGDQPLPAKEHTGHAVRGDGRPADVPAAPTRHGSAAGEHEPGVCARD